MPASSTGVGRYSRERPAVRGKSLIGQRIQLAGLRIPLDRGIEPLRVRGDEMGFAKGSTHPAALPDRPLPELRNYGDSALNISP